MQEDDHTRMIGQPGHAAPQPPPLPSPLEGDDDRTRLISRPNRPVTTDDEATRLVAPPPPGFDTRPAAPAADSDDKTVLLTPGGSAVADAAPVIDFMSDPVVGWLVIVGGPGRGTFVRLGYGLNAIGRAADQRARIDFGDSEISRKNHASLTYDPRGRKFYLQHGGGQNLTYLNDTPVLQPVELIGGETIQLGGTTLRFIPLCGPDFEWQ